MSFEYMHKFWKTYPKKRKFIINKIVSAHEFTGENSRYIDIELAKILNDMDEDGSLDNTIIYLYSDHANHIDFVMLSTRSGFAEKMNPAFMMIIPEHVAEKHHANLVANSQKLMSHYQIFQNSVKYLGLKKKDLHKEVLDTGSLFYDVLPTKGTCN
jgi:membrane-anchored protein YejM (alkaline phosphatase superfamily)